MYRACALVCFVGAIIQVIVDYDLVTVAVMLLLGYQILIMRALKELKE